MDWTVDSGYNLSMNERAGSRLQADELVSMVAHDLRNPLACIEGYTGLMMGRELPQEERAKLLARILSCSRFMEQIIEDLLDSAALERGDLAFKKAPVELPDLLNKALDTMEHTASCRRVILSLSGVEKAHTIHGDSARLQQVIQNLVSNAIKHVPEGTGRVDIRLHEMEDELVVEVADNGEGIAPEHLDRIFEKFYCADADRCRGSLGLGLFIAREIVELHGGRLWVRSEGTGKGASFFFSLPKFQPDRAFDAFKARHRSATPPPRPVSPPPPFLQQPLWHGLAVQLALAGALAAAYLGIARLHGGPSPEPLRDALRNKVYSASAGPLLP